MTLKKHLRLLVSSADTVNNLIVGEPFTDLTLTLFFSLTILNKPHKTIKLTDLYSKADWPSLCLLLHCILGIVRSWEMISIATGLHGFAYYLQQ